MQSCLKRIIFLLLSCFISLLIIDLYAQDSEIDRGEQRFFHLESQLDSLRVKRLKILNQAQIVSQRINMYQSSWELTRKQHQNLEKQLQKSQILEDEIKELEDHMHSLIAQQTDQIKLLILDYQTEIENKLKTIELEKDNLVNRNQIENTLNELFMKKQHWERMLDGPRVTEYQTLTIKSKPWDTSQDLILKSDLLLDREEEIRDEIDTIGEWLLTLRKEESLKKKAEELALDIHFFAEREELLFGDNASSAMRTDKSNILNYGPEAWDGQDQFFNDAGGGSSPDSWSPDFEGQSLLKEGENGLNIHSLDTIQEAIKLLENHQKKLTFLADSLNQCAQRFQEEAESQR